MKKKNKLAKLYKRCTKSGRGDITPLVQKTPQELIQAIMRLQQKLCWLKLKARLARNLSVPKRDKAKSDKRYADPPSIYDEER